VRSRGLKRRQIIKMPMSAGSPPVRRRGLKPDTATPIARGEDEGVLDEGTFTIGMVFQGHGELGGDDGADEHSLAGAHGQGEDVARVIQGEGLVDAFELMVLNETTPLANAVPEGVEALVHDEVFDLVPVEAEGWQDIGGLGIVVLIQVEDVGGIFDQAQVPVGLEGAQLGGAEETEGVRFGEGGVFEDLGDGGVAVGGVAGLAPGGDFLLEELVEMRHWVLIVGGGSDLDLMGRG
jgi:hypothetical protein